MRIGVLELLQGEGGRSWRRLAYDAIIRRQYSSVMPQAISVWCRQLGHQVFYATYFGQTRPERLLPNDLDVVFIAAYTQASPLAYALAKLYRRAGTRTVIGGPHAKSFPGDCLRFFDVVVTQCDRELLADILRDLPQGQVVGTGRPLRELPTVEERAQEIRAASFWRGRPHPGAVVPMLASVGCPYSCNFCTDWNNPYALLSLDQLAGDLRFISKQFPSVLVAYHDPNFAIKFDQVLSAIEMVPPGGRNRYLMESSLSILRGDRLGRLRETRCHYVAPGVESWSDYSNKSGTGRSTSGVKKLDRVVEQFALIGQYVPGIQANFIFGLDTDIGDEPVELTKEFMTRTPFVWPTVNVPIPFGGTPLYDQYLEEGRILKAMPFSFYYGPHVVTTIKNYHPIEYYEKLISLYAHASSRSMLVRRLRASTGGMRYIHTVRTLGMRHGVGYMRGLVERLKSDRELLAFHEGRPGPLPEFYHQRYEETLGPYAPLLSREERTPLLVSGHAASR